MDTDLSQLATVNHHGFAFLLAYGLTWLLAAGVWRWRGQRAGAYAVLLQGVIALPIAFGLMALTAAGPRPQDSLLDELSTALAVSQVFALPILIYLILRRAHRQVPIVLAAVTIVHFSPYWWLYRTPLYMVLAGVLAIGLFVVCRLADRRADALAGAGPDAPAALRGGAGPSATPGDWAIPAFTGAVLVIGAIIALLL
ncbi:hypothetical protein I8D64_03275 [Brachybacterium sp. MASK1Z-5]|uniref:Integral membrane protein n=1 Tax=Brachybacterium halotolerans TaxID=2795215 RepID=A0ABS1B702_9MICO|nr:hypothetical protein [Brachybacterium halotolerans]MBK0330418.1 hypothetical protein [Brachybacterium halotolerans]